MNPVLLPNIFLSIFVGRSLKTRILFFIICFSPVSIFGQTIKTAWGLAPDTSFYYKKSHLSGNEIHGMRVGHWFEYGPDNVVYGEMNYDSAGEPCGLWKLNFPDGNKRIITEYKQGTVAKVTIYRTKMKIVEITGSPLIPETIYAEIRLFEDQHYEQGQKLKVQISSGYSQPNRYWITDYFRTFRLISDLLQKYKFSGEFMVWNEDGDMEWKYTFNNENQALAKYYYNENHKLKKLEEYRKDTLIQTIKFNKKGLPVDTIKSP